MQKEARWAVLGVAAALFAGSGCSGARDEPPHPGQAVYERYCYACHQAGIAGAPALNDPTAWAPRLAQGRETLYANVKRGMMPGMPPRGACPACTDEALEAAVDYMVLHAE
ncbi:MAG: c-type cytochrome [Gammaproteobacteria bacterium]|nr:c-type cytochrome [Gammaproteobacteria bacterium]